MSTTPRAPSGTSARASDSHPLGDELLVIALVGPIGTNLRFIEDELRRQLESLFRYTVHTKKITELPEFVTFLKQRCPSYDDRSLYTRYIARMNAGDALRDRDGPHAMASLVIRDITRNLNGTPRSAFVIRSLKRPEESDQLRTAFGDAFIQVSVYEPRATRVTNLEHRLRREDSDQTKSRSRAERLVDRDEHDPTHTYGQDTRKVFGRSHLFLRAGHDLTQQVDRVLRIIFDDPFVTPTSDEIGMTHAATSARSSASLDRQVGAALCRSDGTLIAAGCNEVPSPGGGQYGPSSNVGKRDARQFALRTNTSHELQEAIVSDLFRRIRKHCEALSLDELKEILEESAQHGARSRIFDLLEFKREVHAEMAAITDAARHGLALSGATLYTTTFPCHECTRHIIAVGVSRVVYVEAYPKSLAQELHGDAIRTDDCDSPGFVSYSAFIGVAPTRFMDYFDASERKNEDGSVVCWRPEEALPSHRLRASQT